MAIPRPLLIALIAAILALVGFYATQGARSGSDAADSSDAIAPVVPAEPAESSRDTEKRARPDATGERKPAPRKTDSPRRAAATATTGLPPTMARALKRKDTVILFLRGSPSADDRAAARAVAGQRGRHGVTVAVDRVGRLGRYRDVVGALGISQTPAVVIVGRNRAARVVEGYIDPATLAQDVADAR
jgi:hypothetical protein